MYCNIAIIQIVLEILPETSNFCSSSLFKIFVKLIHFNIVQHETSQVRQRVKDGNIINPVQVCFAPLKVVNTKMLQVW